MRSLLAILAFLIIAGDLPLQNRAHAKEPAVADAMNAAVEQEQRQRQRRQRLDHYDHFLQLGYTYGIGGPLRLPNHSGPRLAGLRFTERNGFAGRGMTNLLYVVIATMGVSDREYQGSSYTTVGSTTYRVDHYRMLSQEEIDAQYAAIEETSQALMGSAHDGFDFTLYHPALGADATGFNTHFYFAGSRQFRNGRQAPVVFRVGIGGGFIRGAFSALDYQGPAALAERQPDDADWTWWSVSIPLQLHANLTSWLALDLEWELNTAALLYLIEGDFEQRSADPSSRRYGDLRYAPISLSLTFDPVDFLYGRVSGHLGSFSTSGLGASFEAGVRF